MRRQDASPVDVCEATGSVKLNLAFLATRHHQRQLINNHDVVPVAGKHI